MHNCPRCYHTCYCSGDIDDTSVMNEQWVDRNCECECGDFFEDTENFEHCSHCDLPDACNDFGCAVQQGLKNTKTDC